MNTLEMLQKALEALKTCSCYNCSEGAYYTYDRKLVDATIEEIRAHLANLKEPPPIQPMKVYTEPKHDALQLANDKTRRRVEAAINHMAYHDLWFAKKINYIRRGILFTDPEPKLEDFTVQPLTY